MADRWSTSHGPRSGIIGVEPFDTGYGGGFQVQIDAPDAMACELMEDDGAFRVHEPPVARRPRRLAFVDGTMRVELPPQRYVNTHHRPMLAAEAWNQGPGLPAGQRSSLLEAVQHGRYGDGDLRWITFCRVFDRLRG